jgi:hypothetical protein
MGQSCRGICLAKVRPLAKPADSLWQLTRSSWKHLAAAAAAGPFPSEAVHNDFLSGVAAAHGTVLRVPATRFPCPASHGTSV